MDTHLTADESARTRLRDAQKAEITALRVVEAAELVRSRALRRLDSATSTVAAAHVALIRVSGVDRAALLLDLPAKELRRVLREHEMAGSQFSATDPNIGPKSPGAPSSTES